MHISFSELLMILLVALLVVKPERMPEVATQLGKWVKGIRTLFSNLKEEVEKPLSKYSFHEDKESRKE